MKVIKDEDLLFLHKQIEKSEVKQQKLEDLLELEVGKLKKSKKTNRLYGSFSVILLLLAVFLVANAFYSSKSSSKAKAATDNQINELSIVQNELEATKKELELVKNEQINLKEIQDLYLYRSLINKETVYSVQIKALNDKRIASVSEKYTNTLVYNEGSLYKFSLGIFETLSEAQEYRRTLIESGLLDKRIFIISYKDGKRVKIEDFQ